MVVAERGDRLYCRQFYFGYFYIEGLPDILKETVL